MHRTLINLILSSFIFVVMLPSLALASPPNMDGTPVQSNTQEIQEQAKQKLQTLQENAAQGDAEVQFTLGLVYQSGAYSGDETLIPNDSQKAIYWLEHRCMFFPLGHDNLLHVFIAIIPVQFFGSTSPPR